MAAFGTTFNAQAIPPAEPGLPVWEGLVPHVITKTEIKPTAANDGQNFLALHVQAIDGQYKGQENVIRLNLYNRSAQAVDIAQRQLSAICHVTNRMQITDSDQLIGAPFIGVWVKEQREVTDQQSGQKRNIDSCQCKDYRLIDGRTIRELLSGQPASQPAGQPAPQQSPATLAQTLAPQAGAPAPAASAPGFQPPPQAPGFAPSAGAPTSANGGFAPAPHGFQPPQAGPAFGTAGSGGSAPAPGAPAPAFQPPAGGFGAPGARQPAPAPGFQPPAGPQAGPGPWGPQR